MDDIAGKMISTLKNKSMRDNLLFFVIADNGGPLNEGANNYSLKGGKMTD